MWQEQTGNRAFKQVFMEGFREKVAFEWRPEGGEGMCHIYHEVSWRKVFTGKGWQVQRS